MFSGFSHSLISRSCSAGLWSDGAASKLLSARDWFWSFFLKDTAQTDFSCAFVLLFGSVTQSSMWFVLHFNHGENSAFPSLWYYCEVGLSITAPLLELFCILDPCPAVHTWKQKKKKSQIILTLNCENPGAISSHDTYWPTSSSATGRFVFTAKLLYICIFNIPPHSYYLIDLGLTKFLLHKCLPFIFCSPLKGYWSKEPIAGRGKKHIISAMEIQALCTEPLAIWWEELQRYCCWSRFWVSHLSLLAQPSRMPLMKLGAEGKAFANASVVKLEDDMLCHLLLSIFPKTLVVYVPHTGFP